MRAGRSELARTAVRLLFVAFCVGLLSSYAFPKHKSQRQEDELQFLSRVKKASNFEAAGASPFLLQARVEAILGPGNTKLAGAYSLNWLSPNHWRDEVTFPGYRRVQVVSGGKISIAETLPFEPIRVWELNQLFDVQSQWTLGRGESANLQKTRKGSKIQCVKIQNNHAPGREVCADSSTWLPVRMETPIPESLLRTSYMYSEYQSSAGRQFPRLLQAFEGNNLVLEVNISPITKNTTADASAPLPTAYTASWDWCANAEPPDVIENPPPPLPSGCHC